MGERVEINDNSLIVHVDSGSSQLNMLLLATDLNDRIGDDRYSILESNPASPDGLLKLTPSKLSYRYDMQLHNLPETINALLIVAYSEAPIHQSLPLAITINQDASFNAGPCIGEESAIVLAKIYRHQGRWRFNAVSQGYAVGIDRLIESLGGQTA